MKAAKPVTATPAVAKPASATPAAAVPVAAKPAVAKPAAARPASPSKADDDLDLDLPSSRPSRRPRRDDDDEDDRPTPKKKGPNLLLIIGGVLAFVFFLGCAGVVYIGYQAYSTTKEFVEEVSDQPQNWQMEDGDNPFGPGGNPFTIPTQPKSGGTKTTPTKSGPSLDSVWRKDWKLYAQDGFTVSMPGQPNVVPQFETVDGKPVRGNRHEGEEGGVKYRAYIYDLPPDLLLTPGQFLTKVNEFSRFGALPAPKPVMIVTSQAEEWGPIQNGPEFETRRTAKIGNRIFVFVVKYDRTWTSVHSGLNVETKQKDYFGSIILTYRPTTTPKTPPTTTRPTNPATTFNPKTSPNFPTFPPTGTGDPTVGSGSPLVAPPTKNESFKLITSVDPFLIAVSLTKSPELLTFTTRGQNGLMRRISSSTYKTIAERVLPVPVIHAVADEEAGRLYVATVSKEPLVGVDSTLKLSAIGDILVYDLAKVLSNDAAAGDLKPLATAPLGLKIAGLALDPKGKTLYAAVVTMTSVRTKSTTKTQVLKLDAADLRKLGEVDLPQPVVTFKMSPDGSHLLTGEYPYNTFGSPQHGSSAAVALHVIETASFRKQVTIPLPHPVMDLQFQSDGKALAILSVGARQAKIFSVNPKGVADDVTPEQIRHSGGYAQLTPDGTRLVLSGRTLPGSELFVLTDGRWRSLGFTTLVGRFPALGPILFLNGGKTAIYGSGLVVDLTQVSKF